MSMSFAGTNNVIRTNYEINKCEMNNFEIDKI